MAEEIIESDLTIYKKDALNTVSFKIIYNKPDYEKRRYKEFKADMAHQVFGDSEIIYGYRSLSIQLFYHHNSLRCFVDIKHSGKIENSDDIMGNMEPWLQDYTTEEKTFLEVLENEKHDQLFGNILDEFEIIKDDKLDNCQTNVMYKISLCDLQDDHFKEYHKRFETFIVWFIDAANLIDTEDEKWMIFYVYEEFVNSEDNLQYVSPIGFCSVYKFFAYPDKVRPRISQFFVLPTHQRKGIGSKLYHTVVKYLRNMPEAVDITVEEPTDKFQRIRDISDYLEFKKIFNDSHSCSSIGNQKNMLNMMNSLKICKRQKQRLVDILRGLEADKSGTIAYQLFLQDIKKRLQEQMERQDRGGKRMRLDAIESSFDFVNKSNLLEADFNKYVSDIEPSIKCLQKLEVNPNI